MVDRLVAVDDADYRLPEPVRRALAGEVGDLTTEIGVAVQGSRGYVVDTEHATLDNALAAVATGGTLEIRASHARTTPFTVDKPCTIRFTDGNLTTSDPDLNIINITSSDVTIEAPRISGAGVNITGTGRAIQAKGTLASKLRNIVITRPHIDEVSYVAVEVRLCDDVNVTGGQIYNIGYAAVMFLSVTRGTAADIDIHDITQPTGYVNSYGIAVSNWDGTEPRSSECIVRGNRVARVPWEGIDTHGGLNLIVEGNELSDCGAGIAIVSGAAPGSTWTPAENVSVLNNSVKRSTRTYGIVFAGPGGTSSTLSDGYATGCIIGNTVVDSGKDAQDHGAIGLLATRHVTVSGNSIIRPTVSGIITSHNNLDFTIVGNTIVDVASEAILTQAILIPGYQNRGTCVGNTLARSTRVAARVNEYGLRTGAAGAVVNTLQVAGNRFAGGTTPISDAGSMIVRPDVTGSRGGNVALGSLIAQLAANYIVKDSTTA